MAAIYIIIRHGSNAANQSRQQRKVLGLVEALSNEEAKQKAAKHWSLYNNQHFEAINVLGRTRKADRDAAYEAHALANAQ